MRIGRIGHFKTKNFTLFTRTASSAATFAGTFLLESLDMFYYKLVLVYDLSFVLQMRDQNFENQIL